MANGYIKRRLEEALDFLWQFGRLPDNFPVLPNEYGFCSKWVGIKVIGRIEDGKSIQELVRTCPVCGEEKPMLPAYWPRNPDGVMGLYSACRDCKRTADRRYQSKRRRRGRVIGASPS